MKTLFSFTNYYNFSVTSDSISPNVWSTRLTQILYSTVVIPHRVFWTLIKLNNVNLTWKVRYSKSSWDFKTLYSGRTPSSVSSETTKVIYDLKLSNLEHWTWIRVLNTVQYSWIKRCITLISQEMVYQSL